jgi:hypothetical protein
MADIDPHLTERGIVGSACDVQQRAAPAKDGIPMTLAAGPDSW